MKIKRNSVLLVVTLLWAITAIYAKQTAPKKELREVSNLVLKSSMAIGRLENKLIDLYDLADQAAHGSYNPIQREEMDGEFQQMLSTINRPVNRASLDGQNMLNSEDGVISVMAGTDLLEFFCVDVTQKGLGLDGGLKIKEFPDASIAYERLKAAVRKIKGADLQFADYINTLSQYLRNVRPVLDKEIKMTLEITEASKDAAEIIAECLNRANVLTGASISGQYSDAQRTIMNAEFQEMLNECDPRANEVYYGMGMINSTDVLSIEAGGKTLEFICFDLTKAGLGLDNGINIETPQDAQAAYPYIENALKSIQEATTALNNDIDTLSQILQTKKKK